METREEIINTILRVKEDLNGEMLIYKILTEALILLKENSNLSPIQAINLGIDEWVK